MSHRPIRFFAPSGTNPHASIVSSFDSSHWAPQPDDPQLDPLCAELALRAPDWDRQGRWPAESLAACARHGVFAWFIDQEFGGLGWSEAQRVQGYLRLSAACLTTAFIITQRAAACRQIATSHNGELKRRLLPDLATGRTFSTVGISHLTTSRQHLARPVLRAQACRNGYLLDGYSPWVTGGAHAEHLVLGAALDDGRQVLFALPASLPGVESDSPAELVALTASHTAAVRLHHVHVDESWLLDGPVEDVLTYGRKLGTGGLQTSTLALGLSAAAVHWLTEQAHSRCELIPVADALRSQVGQASTELLRAAEGHSECSTEELRARANRLALRTTQAALTAAKGAGFRSDHPASRWCREALFFLVWSCPQPVAAQHLCELAGLAD